jgi:hypothetical protein
MVTRLKLPVLVLAYNRPGLVRELLNSLSPENVSSLFISIDGPKTESDRLKANQIVEIAKEFSDFIPVVIRQSSTNLGCRLGVISGLDWFFGEVPDGGLVLEDDCFPKPEFFEFLAQNIHLIRSHEVAMITAHNPLSEVSEDLYKSRFAFIYGWYTTGSTWEILRKNLFEIALPSRFRKTKNPRSISEATFWWATYARARIGIHDTWDSLFYRAFSKEGFECLVPKSNMVENRGFGEGATHTIDPDGSILLGAEIPAKTKDKSMTELDDLIARHHFKIKLHHTFTPYLRVSIDFLKVRRFPDYNYQLQLVKVTILEFRKPN